MSAPALAPPLSGQRRLWRDRAWAQVRRDRLRELVTGLVDVPSPTGQEAEAAAWAVGALRGVQAQVQPFGLGQANAVARLPGDGSGPDLLLYAPVDTWTSGDPAQDLPWAGQRWTPSMAAQARDDGPYVIGLGAGNPKGHAACVLAAVEALAAAQVPLRGDVVAALGAGGMPTNGRPGLPAGTGHGRGAWHLLEQGGTTDAAVIAKPGWTASYEEVGLAWVEVEVRGTHTYVGSRHRLPYRNALAEAARVVQVLEQWAPQWAREHTAGLVSPQAVVAAVDSGRTWQLAGTPAVVRVLLDVRLAPGTTAPEAVREVRTVLAGADVTVRLLASVPGTRTAPDSPVVRSAVAAWEELEGRPHEDVPGTSGATDANILRLRGVPTVRVGMPKVTDPRVVVDFESGMNTVDVRAMETLTQLLLTVAVDVCTRGTTEGQP